MSPDGQRGVLEVQETESQSGELLLISRDTDHIGPLRDGRLQANERGFAGAQVCQQHLAKASGNR